MTNPTIIASTTSISGNLSGHEDVVIHGRFDGHIELSEILTVAESGFVSGTAKVRQIVISGAFDGDINATEKVILTNTARVIGDILCPLLEMADGAQVAGQLNIGVDITTELPGATTASRSVSNTVNTTRPTSTQSFVTSTPPKTASSSSSSGSAISAQRAATPKTTVVTTVEDEQEETSEADTSTEPQQDASSWTFEDIDDVYTVKELREELRDMDLPVSGTKAELIERLLEAKSSR